MTPPAYPVKPDMRPAQTPLGHNLARSNQVLRKTLAIASHSSLGTFSYDTANRTLIRNRNQTCCSPQEESSCHYNRLSYKTPSQRTNSDQPPPHSCAVHAATVSTPRDGRHPRLQVAFKFRSHWWDFAVGIGMAWGLYCREYLILINRVLTSAKPRKKEEE
ncbi:hypothetical protein PM082_004960 [Marasmius tenuissimus]|nr:hypothetical protein PM082_004960 [Marasmius tenuissimus]